MPTSTTMQGLTTGLCSDHDHSSVIPPAFLFSNYFYDTFGECPPFDYGRGGNPTRALLADALTTLEGSAGAVVTSSGMSAVILVLLSLRTDWRPHRRSARLLRRHLTHP